MKRRHVLDLFAGVGGFSLGFELAKDANDRAAFEIIMVVDNNRHCCETLRNHFSNSIGDTTVIEGDLEKEDVKSEIIRKCRGKVDVIIGGPPCQSFSMIGPRSGNKMKKGQKDIRDNLYRHYLEIVEAIGPESIVFENVRGILSKKDETGKPYIHRIISDFEALDYTFESENKEIESKYLLLNAANFGVPQNRQRVFLIGNSLGEKNSFPKKTHSTFSGNGLHRVLTLKDAIDSLPAVKPKLTFTGLTQSERSSAIKKNKRIYSGEATIPYPNKKFDLHYAHSDSAGREFLDFIRPFPLKELTLHVARPQQKTDIELFRLMPEGWTAKDVLEAKGRLSKLKKFIKYDMSSFTDKYKKLRWDKPSSTIFAHLSKDGNRFIHPDSRQHRTITPREAARIQSFPDYYQISGPKTAQFKQIGNAVPPILAYRIAINLAGGLN